MASTRCRAFFLYWLPVVGYAGFLFYLSSIPGPEVPNIHVWDKWLHLVVYSGFGFLFVRAFQPDERGWGLGRVLLVAVIGAVLYGITDEFHQSFVPSRTPEIADVTADGLGGIVGGIFYQVRRYVWKVF